MSTTIAIYLINNTYGACPWNRAHVEGAIEEIPSSVRLFRSIISGAFHCELGASPVLKRAIEKLASARPIYHIPNGQYVGLQTYRKDQLGRRGKLYKGGKMNVEPYYVYSAHSAFFAVQWDIDLDENENDVIKRSLKQIYYLGRSEHTAVWHLLENTQEVTFNAFPDTNGDESVLYCEPSSVTELWITPGVRNAQLRECKFKSACYRIEAEQETPKTRDEKYDLVVLESEVSYALDQRDTLLWCDRLHKAIVSKLQTLTLRNKTRIILEGGKHFLISCDEGFTEEELNAIESVRALYTRDGRVELFCDYIGNLSDIVTKTTQLISETPYWMVLSPAKKALKNRNDVYKKIANGAFIKFGVEHQSLREFLLKTGEDISTIQWVDCGAGVLGALKDGATIATCLAEVWQSAWDWKTNRFSGGAKRDLYPVSRTGYQLTIYSSEPIFGLISLGFGSNYGLGVLRGSKSGFGHCIIEG